MNASITSPETNTQFLDYCLLQIEWTGTTPIGVVNFEYLELEKDRNSTGLDVWGKLNFGGLVGTDIPISGNTGSHTIIITELSFPRIRVSYVKTSGIGTITTTLFAKER